MCTSNANSAKRTNNGNSKHNATANSAVKVITATSSTRQQWKPMLRAHNEHHSKSTQPTYKMSKSQRRTATRNTLDQTTSAHWDINTKRRTVYNYNCIQCAYMYAYDII